MIRFSRSRSNISAFSRAFGGTIARTPIHRGEHLAEELKELSISAAALARQIDVPVNRVTGIINGQRAITADTALRLGHWFGTSPEFWLNLQKLYELRLARDEVGDRVERLPKRRTASARKKMSLLVCYDRYRRYQAGFRSTAYTNGAASRAIPSAAACSQFPMGATGPLGGKSTIAGSALCTSATPSE